MRALSALVLVGTLSLAPVVGSVAAQPANAHYVVAPGDTLTAIAKRYGVSMPELARANGLNWRRPLLVGTTLRIPGASAPARKTTSGWSKTYVVEAGDTLGAIAARYDVSLSRFALANGLDSEAPLLAGTKLRVPGSVAPPKTNTPTWPRTYVVQAGDTLSGIAARYGVSLSQLSSVNGIVSGGVLLAGQKLHVPGAKPAARAKALTITVEPGDTLSGIAGRYGLSLTTLVAANSIDVNAPLLVGQRLVVPDRVGLDSALLALTRSQADPYVRGSAGLDISYPACGRAPETGAFTVIGLNDGRPFTTNPCFEAEYEAAAQQALPSVYLNSAYGRVMFGQIAADCADEADALGQSRLEERAYAVGCSEAEAAIGALAGTPVAAIWVDVESANTWSTDPALNRVTLEGMLVTLLNRQSASVGVYASPRPWVRITGGWHLLSLPEWIATGPPGNPGCSYPFATGPVWLSQSTPDRGRHDDDIAC
jgi:LysM repeat protein